MFKEVKKIWGRECWLVGTKKYFAKHLHIQRRYECSTHYHIRKDETFYILAGVVDLYVYDLNKNYELFPYRPISKDNFDFSAKYLDVHEELLQHKKEIIEKLVVTTLKQGEQFRLKPFMAHKFRAKTSSAVILEVSTTHYEDDSYRLTSSRKLNSEEYDPGYF